TGMVPVEEAKVIEKGRLGPGQMIGVDIEAGKLYRDRELKDTLAASRPYGEWAAHTVALDSLIRSAKVESPAYDRQALRRHQSAVGWSIEDLELILHPMI